MANLQSGAHRRRHMDFAERERPPRLRLGWLAQSEVTGAQSLAVLNHNLVGDSLNHADAQSTSPLRLMPTRALGPLVMLTRALGLLLSLFASAHGLVIPASTLVVPVPTSSIVQSQPVFTTGDLASPYLGTQEQEPSLFPTADVLAANGEMTLAEQKALYKAAVAKAAEEAAAAKLAEEAATQVAADAEATAKAKAADVLAAQAAEEAAATAKATEDAAAAKAAEEAAIAAKAAEEAAAATFAAESAAAAAAPPVAEAPAPSTPTLAEQKKAYAPVSESPLWLSEPRIGGAGAAQEAAKVLAARAAAAAEAAANAAAAAAEAEAAAAIATAEAAAAVEAEKAAAEAEAAKLAANLAAQKAAYQQPAYPNPLWRSAPQSSGRLRMGM